MTTSSPDVPRLLVSVRSAAEAEAAITGGCDLLDVKEPAHGSLGAAAPETIEAVCEFAATLPQRPPVSVALGELDEWPDDRPVPRLISAVTFAKLGLSGCARRHDWPRRWRGLQGRFDAAAGQALGWIAVLYADSAGGSPHADALIDLATTSGCRGLLVDTFVKDGRNLFDHVRPERLAEWRSAASEGGLLFAVAGSLRLVDLPRLAGTRPDVIALRGAACRDGRRMTEIDRDAVRRLREAIATTFR